MYTLKELSTEISNAVESAMMARAPIQKTWLIQKIISNHPDVNGADADFYTCATRDTIRQFVDRHFRSIKLIEDESSANNQMVLAGFERLQTYYTIERQGEFQIVPIESMSVKELHRKADEHFRQSDGHRIHAEELMRYAERLQDAGEGGEAA